MVVSLPREREKNPPYWVGADYVAEDVITIFGLRRKHIIRKHRSGMIDFSMWIEASPPHAHFWAYMDSAGDFHLIIAWKEAT